MKFRLNQDWRELWMRYEEEHSHPLNRVCHSIGIPLIAASTLAALGKRIDLAIPLFAAGWGFQFLGHFFQGTPPTLVDDRRATVVGALYWARKVGIDLVDLES